MGREREDIAKRLCRIAHRTGADRIDVFPAPACRALRVLVCGAFILALLPGDVRAQGMWDAILLIDPFPSPYYSDWDANPNIGTLTLINGTPSNQPVRILFNVTDRSNRLVASGSSEFETIAAGATVLYDSPYEIAGNTTHDSEFEEIAARTGRLPEGDYNACAVAADRAGFVLAESCSMFTIVYPDPPLLVGPYDGETLNQPDPLFMWTPVQVPIDYQVAYVVRIVEVLEGQTPDVALRSNLPIYQSFDVPVASLRYPLGESAFLEGRTYAWSVQALDQNRYAASANDGRSEIWTFRYDDTPPVPAGPVATTFSLFNTAAGVQSTTNNGTAVTDGSDAGAALEAVCAGASPNVFGLSVRTPFGFPAFRDSPATLYTDTAGGWWVFTTNERLGRQVLLHGDCEGALGGLQWVASKKIGREQSISDWLAVNTPPVGIESLDFGMFVLALSAGDVTVPSEFPQASAFLGGHEIEVLRGLNAFAVLNLHEQAFWPAFQALGYDERQIEIQGFIGFDAEWALGVGGEFGTGSAEAQVDVTRERKFLTLRAALPERTPIGPLRHLIESMRLGIELEIGDEMELAAGVSGNADSSKASVSQEKAWHIVPSITHTMTLRADVFPRIDGSRELVGSYGLDLASETETDNVIRNRAKRTWIALQRNSDRAAAGARTAGSWFGADPDAMICAADPKKSMGAEHVLSYGLDGDIILGSVVIESPALEIHVQQSGDGKAVSGAERELSFAFATVIRGAEWENGIGAGITVERAPTAGAAPADSTCSPRPRSTTRTSRPPGPEVAPGRPRSTTIAEPSPGRPRSNANADQTTPPKPEDKTEWTVGWRIATEGMPMGDLLRGIGDLVRSVRDAIVQ